MIVRACDAACLRFLDIAKGLACLCVRVREKSGECARTCVLGMSARSRRHVLVI